MKKRKDKISKDTIHYINKKNYNQIMMIKIMDN